MLRPLQRNRNVFILIIGVFVIWWTLSARFHGASISEFDLLQQHMNNGQRSPNPRRSSVDWSKIPYRYPADTLTQLPSRSSSRVPKPIQAKFRPETAQAAATREARRLQVKQTFRADWKAYRKYAWMKDALMPISGGYRDQFCGWAATLVDSLDALWILGLRYEFDEAIAAVAQIDFGVSTSGRVNQFETNIRYLGGLLSAYDLSKRKVLLTKAIELGDLLYGGFNTANRMPVDFIDFKKAKTGEGLAVERSVVSASPGTLSLEMTRLSQITGDPKYYDAVSHLMDVFYEGQAKTKLPGLWPEMVSMRQKDVVSGSRFTVAGNADSLYEYLPKMHALLEGSEPKYETMTKRFLDAAQKLFFRPMVPNNDDILIASAGSIAEDGAVVLDQETEHLACYIGGAYAIAGKMLGDRKYVEIGSKLTMGCVYGYKSFPTGMMPERLNMVACSSLEDCTWDEKRFDEEKGKQREWKEYLPLGFTTAKDPRYILRPEAMESVLIMYRVTGNPIWQDIGWEMFTATEKGTRTVTGSHASVQDVTRASESLPQEDYMESFWLAETLKYYYLLFCPPDIISLDDYVLNTEAHPFRRSR